MQSLPRFAGGLEAKREATAPPTTHGWAHGFAGGALRCEGGDGSVGSSTREDARPGEIAQGCAVQAGRGAASREAQRSRGGHPVGRLRPRGSPPRGFRKARPAARSWGAFVEVQTRKGPWFPGPVRSRDACCRPVCGPWRSRAHAVLGTRGCAPPLVSSWKGPASPRTVRAEHACSRAMPGSSSVESHFPGPGLNHGLPRG